MCGVEGAFGRGVYCSRCETSARSCWGVEKIAINLQSPYGGWCRQRRACRREVFSIQQLHESDDSGRHHGIALGAPGIAQ
jgi:hypothetical protein